MKYYDKSFNNGTNILVFGSNEAGYHGAGSAKDALLHWGAIYRQGIGRQGMSYGIPTKDDELRSLDLDEINIYVQEFLAYAAQHPELKFLVTRIGCGYAGYTDKDIAPMFKGVILTNLELPEEWKSLI